MALHQRRTSQQVLDDPIKCPSPFPKIMVSTGSARLPCRKPGLHERENTTQKIGRLGLDLPESIAIHEPRALADPNYARSVRQITRRFNPIAAHLDQKMPRVDEHFTL